MDTVERYYHIITTDPPKKLWGEINRGLYLIRGENVAYLGEVDLDLEDDVPEGWEKVDAEEIHRLDKSMREQQKGEVKGRNRRLRERGLEREGGEEHIFV
jgi:U6 snRNA-associated Sm-like protein LSm1